MKILLLIIINTQTIKGKRDGIITFAEINNPRRTPVEEISGKAIIININTNTKTKDHFLDKKIKQPPPFKIYAFLELL